MFNTILGETLDIKTFAICIAVAFALGLVVALVHQKTSPSNKNFITTLAVLPVLVTMVILLVNGNLGTSVAILGAFGLVRFRSIPGNSRAIMDVFFAMAIGLAVGTGYIGFAALFTIVVSLFIILLSALNFGQSQTDEKKLTIMVPEDIDYTSIFDQTFAKFTTTHSLERSKTTNMGSLFELRYRVKLKKGINEKQFIDHLRVQNGNLKVMLSQPLAEEEL